MQPIKAVANALKKLVDEENGSERLAVVTTGIERAYFCIEDVFLSQDIKITVEDIGPLNFPLDNLIIEKLVKISSKAKFGMGKETVLDTTVRDTQTIPASKLKVDINEHTFNNVLRRIGTGLNIDNNSNLVPQLYNMLIYGPGQFFKMHTDSEKIENMVATLVIVLPSPHKGGELIIEHNAKKYMFFGSRSNDIINCIAFYSDCNHEIKKVTEGYRVALTYNVALQQSNIRNTCINNTLNTALQEYFSKGNTKLVYGLEHSYSEHSLKWTLLKGIDRTRANALFAVAKNQGRVPCLALANYHELFDVEHLWQSPLDDPMFVDSDTELSFWVDENDVQFENDDDYLSESEFVYFKKTKDLFKPYKIEASGPTGNEGDTEDFWYKRACVVLWSNKWIFLNGFKKALCELHLLTKQVGMQQVLLKKINSIGKDFIQPHLWKDHNVADMLIHIILYLKDIKIATEILSEIMHRVLDKNHIDRLLQLEETFDDNFWNSILKCWEVDGLSHHEAVYEADSFIHTYLSLKKNPRKSLIIDTILEKGVNHVFVKNYVDYSQSVYRRTEEKHLNKLVSLLKICAEQKNAPLEEKLINYLSSDSAEYPAVSLGELYCKLYGTWYPSQLPSSYQLLINSAEKAITSQLKELTEDVDWSFPYKQWCECKECLFVINFFNSKLSKCIDISATKKHKDHLEEEFDFYSNYPYSVSVEKDGRKFKIIIKKSTKLIENRQKLKRDLVLYKDKLQQMRNFKFVPVKCENKTGYPDEHSDVDVQEIKTENLDSGEIRKNETTLLEASVDSAEQSDNIVLDFQSTIKIEPDSIVKDEAESVIKDEYKTPIKRRKEKYDFN